MSKTDNDPAFIGSDDLVRRGWANNRKSIDQAAARGELPHIRIGRRRLFPLAWVEAVEAGDIEAMTQQRTSSVA